MKKLIIIVFFLVTTSLFGQKQCFIKSIDHNNVVYDVYKNSSLIATNQVLSISYYGMTQNQLKAAILADCDSLYNINITNYRNIDYNLGNSWKVYVDSAKINGANIFVSYHINDNESALVKSDIFILSNTKDFSRKKIKERLVNVCTLYKDAELFVRNSASLVNTYIQ